MRNSVQPQWSERERERERDRERERENVVHRRDIGWGRVRCRTSSQKEAAYVSDANKQVVSSQ
jgi:hypothetical protein